MGTNCFLLKNHAQSEWINFQLQLIESEWSRWTIFRCVCRCWCCCCWCCWTVTLIYGRAYITKCIRNQTRLIKVFDLIACWIAYIFYYGTTKARLMAFISLFQRFILHVFAISVFKMQVIVQHSFMLMRIAYILLTLLMKKSHVVVWRR